MFPPSATSTAATQRDHWPRTFERLQMSARDARLRRFYAGGTVQPDTPLVNAPLLAMDFETTGMDPQACDIVSIGITPFSVQRIFCRESSHWIINPARQLTEASIVYHSITHSEVDAAPPLASILDELLTAMTGRLVVVHYHQIERAFLATALHKLLGERIEFPVIDTMQLETAILQQQQSWLSRLLRQPVASVRLGDCRERYGLPHYQPHHALTDALATAELLQAQTAHHLGADTAVAQLWC
jgi:DNA polymerase-3 subunit epsilon